MRTRSLVFVSLFAFTLISCQGALENRDPVGEAFPRVTGTALSGESVTLPDDLSGKPALLLVGYVQDTQFDIDRWLYGILQAETPVQLLELPTIPSLVAGAISGSIDEGMREGIPEEDWSLVVTLYDDAEPVVALTGNTLPRNARVLLLDGEGVVRWFHDRGYSARVMLELDRLAREL